MAAARHAGHRGRSHYLDLLRASRPGELPRQACVRHRQAKLGVRDRRRPAALVSRARPRLAPPGAAVDPDRVADGAACTLRAAAGPPVRWRHLHRGRDDRCDRAQRRRLDHPHPGYDPARRELVRGGRGDRLHRVRRGAARPRQAGSCDVLQGPPPPPRRRTGKALRRPASTSRARRRRARQACASSAGRADRRQSGASATTRRSRRATSPARTSASRRRGR